MSDQGVRSRLERDLGLPMPEMLSAKEFLKKPVPGTGPRVYYYARKRSSHTGIDRLGFYVESDADTAKEAERLGKRWRKAMIPRSKLHYSIQSLHELPLYMGWGGSGYVEIPPLAKKIRKKNEELTKAEARAQLSEGETVVWYRLTLEDALADPQVRAAMGGAHLEGYDEDPRAVPSARLAEKAGFDVEIEAQEWDNGQVYVLWNVTAPAGLDAEIQALAWDMPDGELNYTLTRSTTHPGWQLTTWATDGLPWGHRDIYGDVSEAFDADPMAVGVPLKGLTQVVFRDGRVLVREGAKRITLNPARRQANPELKRRLMR